MIEADCFPYVCVYVFVSFLLFCSCLLFNWTLDGSLLICNVWCVILDLFVFLSYKFGLFLV
jgi:hypothetical protein